MRETRARPRSARRILDLGLRGLRLAVLPCVLILGTGCRAVESPEELEALAGEGAARLPAATPSPAFAGASPAAGESLGGLPLLGPVSPALGGRLHSALCDPASDPYGTCL